MPVQSILSIILISLGIFFMFVGSVGIVSLPDFYSRTHAVSKSDTLGVMFVVLGLIVFEGFTMNSLKLLFIVIFILLANPIGSHALARAAMLSGLKPKLNGKKQNQEEV
ncbi:MAG: monovalent cation/H(+) antiporter subunit G [Balneolaceae bacterium]